MGMNGPEPTAADYAQAAASDARGKAEANGRELEQLRWEVQQLRQFCLTLLRNNPFEILPRNVNEHWWRELGGYEPVAKPEPKVVASHRHRVVPDE